jgi:hypothetical protein
MKRQRNRPNDTKNLQTASNPDTSVIRGEKERDVFKVEKDENGQITQSALFEKKFFNQILCTFGTVDKATAMYLLEQLGSASPRINDAPADSEVVLAEINRITPLLAGIGPSNELEGMLACQMVAVHNLAMMFLARAAQKDQTSDVIDRNVNRATKLTRTFTSQIEALARHRGKGQQKITVEHVHVESGGQAIVGITNTRGEQRGL